jgi:hypothetical protein
MSRKAIMVVCLAVIAVPVSSWGQSQSLRLADTLLRLGVSKNEVTESLSSRGYDLKKSSKADGSFLIVSKSDPTYKPGSVIFEDGKLSRVIKDWGTFDEKASALGMALFGVVSKIGKKGAKAVIAKSTEWEPRHVNHKVDIVFESKRRISISVFEDLTRLQRRVSITESIGGSER